MVVLRVGYTFEFGRKHKAGNADETMDAGKTHAELQYQCRCGRAPLNWRIIVVRCMTVKPRAAIPSTASQAHSARRASRR